MLKKFLPLLPVLLLAGCTTATFTRLTPGTAAQSRQSLSGRSLRLIPAQQSLRWDSIQAYVLVNGQALPMRQVPMVKNRWEGLVPVPPGVSTVNYRFKFDYLYNNFGTAPKPNSVSSKIYTLKVVDQ
jgi:hypothetical protein